MKGLIILRINWYNKVIHLIIRVLVIFVRVKNIMNSNVIYCIIDLISIDYIWKIEILRNINKKEKDISDQKE